MSIHSKIETLVSRKYPNHPLSVNIDYDNVEKLLSQYLAFCQCAPFIIGGANKDLFINAIKTGREIDNKIEITTAVSNFLAFDETGNYERIQKNGEIILGEFTNTDNFHYNILKRDFKLIFNKDIQPKSTPELLSYFMNLVTGLSSLNDIQRCACLVALEFHSEVMIKALWSSLLKLYPNLGGNKLMYFYLHVGGENPAEKYHVEMTESMIHAIVSKDQMETFFSYFESYYSTNIELCHFFIRNS